MGQNLSNVAVQARAFNNLGVVDRRRGDSEAALTHFQQSLQLYEQQENLYGQAMSHNLIANGYFMRGEWSRSDHHYRRSLELFTQIGNAYNQVLVNNNLGGIALKQGRLEATLAYYQRAVRLLEQIGGSLWVFGALYMNLGHVYVARDELALAAANLELAQDYFDQAQLRDLLPELYGLFAEVNWQQGNLTSAEEYGQRSLKLARELSMPREEGHNLRIMGEILRTQQQPEEAQNYFEHSYQVLVQAGDMYESAKTQWALARLHGENGRIEEAQQALALCEPIFTQLEAQLDLQQVNRLQVDLMNR